MSQTNPVGPPVGIELFSYVTLFCFNKFAWLLVSRVKFERSKTPFRVNYQKYLWKTKAIKITKTLFNLVVGSNVYFYFRFHSITLLLSSLLVRWPVKITIILILPICRFESLKPKINLMNCASKVGLFVYTDVHLIVVWFFKQVCSLERCFHWVLPPEVLKAANDECPNLDNLQGYCWS